MVEDQCPRVAGTGVLPEFCHQSKGVTVVVSTFSPSSNTSAKPCTRKLMAHPAGSVHCKLAASSGCKTCPYQASSSWKRDRREGRITLHMVNHVVHQI